VLRSPAPSLAVRAKLLSLQLAGRPRPPATRSAPTSGRPGGRKGRCPPELTFVVQLGLLFRVEQD
jgi:hypothetical protein